MRCLVLLAAALGLSDAAAAAEPAPAKAVQAAPDAGTLAAAREFMATTDIRGQMRAIMPKVSEAARANVQQMFGQNAVPEGLQTEFMVAIRAHMATFDGVFTPELIDQMATIYARHLSAADLRRLTALMRDPAMAKLRDVTPAITGELMPAMMAAMKPQQEVFMAKMKQIVADWMRDHPADKAKLVQPSAS
ncbi:DUF2059 domain-containing protein [Sphingomonas sp. ID0503]|uniref:DUF2059 domain-containing protein n=1 Tax=Sphingomonas sp. ID0503 TaxID=3399691 RepID=UPI003AFA6298